MPRSILVVLAFVTMSACATAQEPAPSPAASPEPEPGVYTEADFKGFTETRLERVLAAYPKMQAWLHRVDKEGQVLNEGMPQAMLFAKDSVSADRFAKEVGMPMDEFYRDWGLVVAVHGSLIAEESYLAGRAELEKIFQVKEAPEEARAAVREQIAIMERQRDRQILNVPAPTKALIAKNRKRIEVLTGATGGPPAVAPPIEE